MALQAMLAQNTAVALASVVHVFVLRTFGTDYPCEASALQVSPQLSAYALEAVADDLKTSRAWQAVQQAEGGLAGPPARAPGRVVRVVDRLAPIRTGRPARAVQCVDVLDALPGAEASASANNLAAALGLVWPTGGSRPRRAT